MNNLDVIKIEGAREHNLKNISIDIPKNQLVVITGISGSGKSSLAFDTIYAEGQRRYMESFAAYARQFIGDLERPDVDSISGLSPVISIEQKTTNRNPRSTVGTVTEVYDFMRLLFASIGRAYSYHTNKRMQKFSEDEIVQHISREFSEKPISILAPLIRGRKGHYRELFEQLRRQGFLKVRIDGEVTELKERMQLDRYKIHDIEVVIDRLPIKAGVAARLSQSVQKALKTGKEVLYVLEETSQKTTAFSRLLMCIESGLSYEEPSPNSFSFNSPYGYCPTCKGLGQVQRINMQALIPDSSKSIKEKGIALLDPEKENWTYKQVVVLAKKEKISLSSAIEKLPEEHLNLILYGNRAGTPTYDNDQVNTYHEDLSQQPFEGLINMLQRWFNETTSESIRDWVEIYMELQKCPDCNGARLRKESLWFKVHNKNISELAEMSLLELQNWMQAVSPHLSNQENVIARDILKEIIDRNGFLLKVGLHYLNINRPTRTLSGGESQRIRLATQIGAQLSGITYILDEPSIGLHQRDNEQLIEALKNLRNGGNSVLVVEHDKDIMLAADYLIDIGPAAGVHGGRIVSEGTPATTLKQKTITAQFLNNQRQIALPKTRRKGNGHSITLKGAQGNNLKNVTLKIPLATLTCITGVSGSGKSTLINDTLYPIIAAHCYPNYKQEPMPYKKIEGLDQIDKVIEIDQSPIGRSPRSNPATYSNFFNEIRQLFTQVPEAKIRGYKPGRFSFNVKGGRCEHCQGGGMRVIEMNFLPDVYVPCEVCNGRRYNRETLEIRFKGKSISDVLLMTVDEAVEFFINVPFIHRKIKTLQDVGLGYITLGQSAVTLSGGEAQRIKLAEQLAKRDTGKTFYILDEPTTGLHFQDIDLLLNVLQKLVDRGNTVVVIEHNLDVIKVADHIIDIGPEGGNGGGEIVVQGTPEQVCKSQESHTARFLKLELASH